LCNITATPSGLSSPAFSQSTSTDKFTLPCLNPRQSQGSASPGQGKTSHSFSSFGAGHWYVLANTFVFSSTGVMLPSRYIPHEPFSFDPLVPYINTIDQTTKRAGVQGQYFSKTIPTGFWGSFPLDFFTPLNYGQTNISPEVCWRETNTEQTTSTQHYTPDFYYLSGTPSSPSGFNYAQPNVVLRSTSVLDWAAYLAPNTTGPQLCPDMTVGCCSTTGRVCFSSGLPQTVYCSNYLPNASASSLQNSCPSPYFAVVDRFQPYLPTFVKLSDSNQQVRVDIFAYGTSNLFDTFVSIAGNNNKLMAWKPRLPIGKCWFGIPYTWGREPSSIIISLTEGHRNVSVQVLYDGPLHSILAASFLEVFHVDSGTSLIQSLINVSPGTYLSFSLPPLPVAIRQTILTRISVNDESNARNLFVETSPSLFFLPPFLPSPHYHFSLHY